MSTEENKTILRRFYEEVFNAGNLDVIDELSSPDIVDHEAPPGMPNQGIEAVRNGVAMFRTAFPDIHITVEDMIAEGDTVTARYTMTGTHQGEFMGIPPTGKQVTVSGMDFLRIAGGRAVEHWGRSDDLGMMQQLGVIPASGQAGG